MLRIAQTADGPPDGPPRAAPDPLRVRRGVVLVAGGWAYIVEQREGGGWRYICHFGDRRDAEREADRLRRIAAAVTGVDPT